MKNKCCTTVLFFIILQTFLISCSNDKNGSIYEKSDKINVTDDDDQENIIDSAGLPDENGQDDVFVPDNDDDTGNNDTDGQTDTELNDERGDADESVQDDFYDADSESDDEDIHTMTLNIELPAYSSLVEADNPVTFKGSVNDSRFDESDITMTWTIREQITTPVVLLEEKADSSGVSEFQHVFSESEAKYYAVKLTAKAPDGLEMSTNEVIFGICVDPFGGKQTFDATELGEGWVLANDSFRDSDGANGWLELTGSDFNKRGLIYNSMLKVYPGDITMRIKIRTGQPGIPTDTGADGFAMTVIDAEDQAELESYASAVRSGGCLGYGVAGVYCGSGGEMDVSAFHIEFDTWYNSETGIDDPTTENHVAINTDGNPGEHLLWKNTLLEDNSWHDIEIKTDANRVTVKMDSAVIIDDTIADFSFRGGYIFFSGSTGAAKNFHSVDDLEVVQECRVPD